MLYSAVTQPLPFPAIHGGTLSSTLAVHNTVVRPARTITLPAAAPYGAGSMDQERRESIGRDIELLVRPRWADKRSIAITSTITITIGLRCLGRNRNRAR